MVVAATVGASAVFLVARTAIDDVLRVKAEPVPHNRRQLRSRSRNSVLCHEAALPARLERGAEFERAGPVREVPGLDPVEDAALA